MEVSCHRCPRRGRYRVTRLIDQHGPNKLLLELKQILSADCPKSRVTTVFDCCGIYFPQWKLKASQ